MSAPQLPNVPDVSPPEFQLRPDITLPELVKICDAAMAEWVRPPLQAEDLVPVVGKVKGRLMSVAMIFYFLIRDEARTEGVTPLEFVCGLGMGFCVLAGLAGVFFDAMPTAQPFSAAFAFAVAMAVGAAARYMSGGDQR